MPDEEMPDWLRAWDRARTADVRRPSGAVRFRVASPRQLGVHPAIEMSGASGELPMYVPRDFDDELRAAVGGAAENGGFVVLVGSSSVGKTRSLYEATRAMLPDWWLVDPADAEAIRALAAVPAPRTVAWLDNLRRFLDADPEIGVAGSVRRLMSAGTVLLGTMWPDEYVARSALPSAGRPDRYAIDRELLGLARVITVPDRFSAEEQRNAEAVLATDPRIRAALDATDAGLTQVLAAGPELITRWRTAPPYAEAVITAAADVRRLGVHMAPTRELLAAAAPGYLTATQRAAAPSDWLDHALAYATSAVRGAASIVAPVSVGLHDVAGYAIADFLASHIEQARHGVPVPDTIWQALRDHSTDVADLLVAGRAAEEQLRFRYAELLYGAALSAGSAEGGLRLADLLYLQDRSGEALELLGRIQSDNAAFRTAKVLAAAGQVDELRERANAGDAAAAQRLVEVLAGRGRVDELRERADAGDPAAGYQLAELLVGRGQVDEALALLGEVADRGDQRVRVKQAELLAESGREDEAIWMLQGLVATGDEHATAQLAERLAERGRIDDLLRLAEMDSQAASAQLARLLAERGDLSTLRARAEAGDAWSAERLVRLPDRQDDGHRALQRLRQMADLGLAPAAAHLARLLARDEEIDELRARAADGDPWAATAAIEVLGDDVDEQLMAIVRRLADAPGWTGRRVRALLATRSDADRQDRLASRYRLIQRLAAGASGSVVWRAYDEELERSVLVKMLAGAPDAQARQRALEVAALSHPNVGSVYDVGDSMGSDGSVTSYVVTEPSAGRSLRRQLAGGPLPAPSALRVAAGLAAGLSHLHDRGIVHGDLRPENVLLTPDGAKWTLVDFGAARPAGRSEVREAITYRAPELAGETAQSAGDIYALGVLMYEMFTGQQPSPTADATEGGGSPDLEGLPIEVTKICNRCLATDPRARPGSSEVARVLAAAVARPAVGRGPHDDG
ncbi:protein kinase domain-containing protein [Actinoplanes sp. CA-142083]|uniref:protein kinase domain-containing protein n=1 Tax=Actinoplanes sp. CA-142083 TaxID=3239903 RepID=UPI003D9342CB